MADPLFLGLYGREAGQVARSPLGMNVLAIFVGPLQSRDQANVLDMLLERFHGRGQFQRIDARFVDDAAFFLRLIRIKPADEAG